MLKTILVALDGTERDEDLLRYVIQLAYRLASEVVLLRAALAKATPGKSAAEAQLEAVSAAEEHLSRLERQVRAKGIKVRGVVPYGGLTEAVVENALLLGADAVALANGAAARRQEIADLAEQLARAGLPILVVPTLHHNGGAAHQGVHRCHNCGLHVDVPEVSVADRCSGCSYPLRACPNCQYYDGIICLMDNPQSLRRHRGTKCADFQFRGADRHTLGTVSRTEMAAARHVGREDSPS